ncbi:MAG: DMT family transporter [Candidatus Azobacteroides sp.]|nr:DMT family transporter [Candidatus Azobacteroides sp.]
MTKFKGIALGLLSSASFGLIPSFSIPLMREGMGIASILFYRFLFSTLFILPLLLFRKDSIRIDVKQIVILSVLSIFFAATSLGLIWSYSFIPSGITTTIHFLYPILVAIVMMYFFREKRSILIFLSALFSFMGVALLCWSDTAVVVKMIGIYIALATVVTYAVYIVGVNRFGINRINSLIVLFYIVFFGTILFGIYALSTTGIEAITTKKEWMYLIILAFLPTVVSDFALILSIKYAGETIAAILGVMEPVVAVCMGVWFFSESFNLYSFIGLIIVLFSVIMTIIVGYGKK